MRARGEIIWGPEGLAASSNLLKETEALPEYFVWLAPAPAPVPMGWRLPRTGAVFSPSVWKLTEGRFGVFSWHTGQHAISEGTWVKTPSNGQMESTPSLPQALPPLRISRVF